MGSSYFCHLPLVLGKDKKKFSKRHGATYAQTFLDEGYLREAFVNYISLVGWSSGDDQEIFSKEELIEKFTIERINNGTYGYCEETGEPIGVERLEARPVATLCLEAQERHERMEKTYSED